MSVFAVIPMQRSAAYHWLVSCQGFGRPRTPCRWSRLRVLVASCTAGSSGLTWIWWLLPSNRMIGSSLSYRYQQVQLIRNQLEINKRVQLLAVFGCVSFCILNNRSQFIGILFKYFLVRLRFGPLFAFGFVLNGTVQTRSPYLAGDADAVAAWFVSLCALSSRKHLAEVIGWNKSFMQIVTNFGINLYVRLRFMIYDSSSIAHDPTVNNY